MAAPCPASNRDQLGVAVWSATVKRGSFAHPSAVARVNLVTACAASTRRGIAFAIPAGMTDTTKKVTDKIDQAADKIKDGVDKLGKKLEETREKRDEARDRAGEKIKDLGERAGEKIQDAGKKLGEVVESAGKKLDEKLD